uniref:G protein-coupled receptor n=1 Tax=Caenorhabditis tropicalis TaxID=1561998 RepID=A0A1I7T1K9_9PELO
MTYFLQFRNVQNTRSLAILCQGPCKYIGPSWCFKGYTLLVVNPETPVRYEELSKLQPAAATAGALNIHMLYYRMAKMKNEKIRLIHGFWYLVPIIVVFCFYLPPIDLEFVYEETVSNHPDYDYSPYLKFGGFANSHSIYAVFVNSSLMISAIFAPIFGYRWRKETLSILDKHKNSLSASRIAQFRALIHEAN